MSYYVTGRRQYYRGKWPGDSVADCIRTVSPYPTGRRVHERSWAINPSNPGDRRDHTRRRPFAPN